jgi:hypothetical protein
MYRNAWDDEKKQWKDDDFNAEQFVKEIKEKSEKPEYQSASQTLQDTLNTLTQKGIQIGEIEFFQTELPLLRDAIGGLGAALRDRQAAGVYPSQELTILPGPEGGIDFQQVMNEELYKPRKFWEAVNTTVSTRYFLENDQQARAYIDASAASLGRSVDDVIDYLVTGRDPIGGRHNRSHFDANFQGMLDTAMDPKNRLSGVIDELEYVQVIKDLVDSLRIYSVGLDTLREVKQKLVDKGILIHGEIIEEL